ncbi:sel1 repeat family protein [uncultured Photobacterium sp.]|uniref:tetratricopeptide repeat protein n=1 Tax=uncultured Photobacterium sp. TaxID=173973 RepID=UPI002628ECA6|nr:sel1 repeat family protein [uncultured Photobacterium sp.]
MSNNTKELNLAEIEEQLLNASVPNELLDTLKESSVENAEVTELMYQYYLDSNDYKNAMYYLELGDKFGDGYAQLCLASLYQQGQHCPQDEQRSQSLFEKAAQNGEPEAQYQLGAGLLLAANNEDEIEQGVYWLNESFLNGNDDSKELIDTLCA